ncbi:hypothetical protein KEM48_012793 [Puccinia striiformis f. sp. tritici PST-130]|nr:hypothetical protein KEM48_012793 [Puccinia striiformis f. sp. tritici PST-130]
MSFQSPPKHRWPLTALIMEFIVASLQTAFLRGDLGYYSHATYTGPARLSVTPLTVVLLERRSATDKWCSQTLLRLKKSMVQSHTSSTSLPLYANAILSRDAELFDGINTLSMIPEAERRMPTYDEVMNQLQFIVHTELDDILGSDGWPYLIHLPGSDAHETAPSIKNIGARNGNLIYKEFALTVYIPITHGNHGDITISKTIYLLTRGFEAYREDSDRATKIRLPQPETKGKFTKKKNDIDDHSSSSDSSEEIILISRRSPQSRKGKEKPIDYLSVEIDDYDDDHRSDLTESETDTHHHQSTTDDNNLPPFFDRHRTPTNSHHGYVTDQLSSNQLGKIQLLPTVKVITMSPEDEKNFIQFMDKYPQGDLRLSTKLYEIYHSKAPQYTADEYRAYYLEYQNKHRKRPAPWCPEQIVRKKTNKEVQDQVSFGSESASSRHTTVLENQDEQMNSKRNEIDSQLDALSVSDGSTDELDLDYILDTSNPDHIKTTHFFNDTSFRSLKDSEDQVDKDHSPSTTISGQEKSKSTLVLKGVINRAPVWRTNCPRAARLEPSSARTNPQETRSSKSRSERRVRSETKTMTPTDSTGLTSGQISRRSSFKPARPPDSVDEALKLLEVFLEDFGDLYSGLEAAKLLHQCGDWSIMFELATLKRIDQQLKQASCTTTNNNDLGDGGTTVDVVDHEVEELDPDYFARIQKMVGLSKKINYFYLISISLLTTTTTTTTTLLFKAKSRNLSIKEVFKRSKIDRFSWCRIRLLSLDYFARTDFKFG